MSGNTILQQDDLLNIQESLLSKIQSLDMIINANQKLYYDTSLCEIKRDKLLEISHKIFLLTGGVFQ